MCETRTVSSFAPDAVVLLSTRDGAVVPFGARRDAESRPRSKRRGNRIVGVEPRVVTVVPPKERLRQWEKDRRHQIEEVLDRDVLVAMVAREPYLLMKVLGRIQDEGVGGSETARQIVAQGLARTARAVASEGVHPGGTPPRRSQKREVEEWVALLEELATQLANGHFYNRDLASIDEPLSRLVERYVRRCESR